MAIKDKLTPHHFDKDHSESLKALKSVANHILKAYYC
jgi:hypothetical protein